MLSSLPLPSSLPPKPLTARLALVSRGLAPCIHSSQLSAGCSGSWGPLNTFLIQRAKCFGVELRRVSDQQWTIESQLA